MLHVILFLGAFVLVLAASGLILWRVLAVPRLQPLSEEDVTACREIIDAGRGRPLLCWYSTKTGACPCQPCARLENARKGRAASP